MAEPGELRKFGPVRDDHHEDAPKGDVEIILDYVKKDDRAHSLVAPDGTRRTLGQPIEELRARFGGDTGYVTDPWGNQRLIELRQDMPSGKDIFVKVTYRFEKANRSHH